MLKVFSGQKPDKIIMAYYLLSLFINQLFLKNYHSDFDLFALWLIDLANICTNGVDKFNCLKNTLFVGIFSCLKNKIKYWLQLTNFQILMKYHLFHP